MKSHASAFSLLAISLLPSLAVGQAQWTCGGDMPVHSQFRPIDLGATTVVDWETSTSIGTGEDVFVPAKFADGNRGAVWVFRKQAAAWTQVQKITAPSGAANDYFGVNISASGDWLVVGGRVWGGGAAYFYKKENGNWVYKQTLTGTGGFFGYRLATDGTRAIIGANGEVSSPSPVRVYLRTGDTWAFEQQLPQPSGDASYFGNRLNISGNTAVAITGLASVARYHVYQRTVTGWQIQQTVADPTFIGSTSNAPMDSLRLITFSTMGPQRSVRVYNRASENDLFTTYRTFVAPSGVTLAASASLSGSRVAVPEQLSNGLSSAFIFDMAVSGSAAIGKVVTPSAVVDWGSQAAFHGGELFINQRRSDNTWAVAQVDLHEDCNSNGIWDRAEVCGGLVTDANVNGIPDSCEVPECKADVGRQGGLPGPDGQLDNNDFVIFIAHFFSQLPAADVGRQGGVEGPDGQFDNNDFIVFINQFFAGC